MKINNVIMLSFVAFFVINNMFLKLISLIFSIYLILFLKKEKIIVKKEIDDIIVGFTIIFINNIISIDLDIINFILLVILNAIFYWKFSAFKFIYFYNLYLVAILIKGVIAFWENI